MIRLLHARLRARRNDEGIALVMVIGISMVLMILVTVALGVSLSSMTKSKTDESWNAAIAAAYAAVEDYKSKIAEDSGYWRYGNAAAPFSEDSTITEPTDGNPAFGTGVGGSWAVIPDENASDADHAYFRYEVNNEDYPDTGVLKIRATGRVGDVTRSVVANLKQKGFIDFIYYTTYEINYAAFSALSTTNQTACEKYAYAGRLSNSACSGVNIAFGSVDEINGPMHSNDTIRACGTTFNGAVTTSYTPASGNAYTRLGSGGAACPSGSSEVFSKGKPVSVSTLDLPLTNKKMFSEVRTDIPAETPRPGCLYSGPTKIVFNGDGTMTVKSPWTKVTRIQGAAGTAGTNHAECGEPGIGTGQLGSAGGARVTVPERNLIYVQDVQFVSANVTATQPQWKTGTFPPKPTTGNFTATDCSAGNFLGYPLVGELVPDSITNSYSCKKGDVFVEGTLDGEVTINAENFIYITDDIKYDTTSPDSVLGLVAQNQVWIWNPIKSSDNKNFYTDALTINAAMLSVNKTVQVQNYDKGSGRGLLTVYGAIAQKFRGPVATTNSSTGALVTGFRKEYNYDDRFAYTAPPKFLSPVTTTYGISTIVESKTAYNADGSAIPE